MKKKQNNEKGRSLILLGIIIVFLGIPFALILGQNNNQDNTIDISAYKDAEIYSNGDTDGEIINTDVTLFQTIKNSDQVAIIYIARPSCSFCNKFKPIVEEVAAEYGLDVYYTNIDEWNSTDVNNILFPILREFEGTPTTLIMYKGKQANVFVGYDEKESFVNFLKNNNLIRE